MREPVVFHEIMGGYFIGGQVFPALRGFEFILKLILCAGQSIPCWKLCWPNRVSEPSKDEKENARSTVWHGIRKTTNILIASPITLDTGFHLLDNIDTGSDCTYLGDWFWNCESSIHNTG